MIGYSIYQSFYDQYLDSFDNLLYNPSIFNHFSIIWSRMKITIDRHQQILDLLQENSNIRVPDLSEQLGVSEATVRRDLEKLEISGYIQRKHGGAKLTRPNPPEPPVILRMQENLPEKQRIGRAAADLVNEGDVIFIGSGTTTLEVARNVRGKKNLTVITNAQTVTDLLSYEEGISLVSTGGLLRHSEQSFLGHITVQALHLFRPGKVFMGIRSIDIDEGLTSDDLHEVDTGRAIIESGYELIIVADHTKFGKFSPAFVAPITVVKTLVTDDQTPAETINALQKLGINVIVC